jgi:hypothetical protein
VSAREAGAKDHAHGWRVGSGGERLRYEITFCEDASLFSVRASGCATVAGFEAYLEETLEHPSWRPGMNLLADLRELDTRDLSGDDVRTVAALYRRASERLGNGRCAVVISTPASFGLARMWELYSKDAINLRVGVFRSIDEAREWLESS